MPEATHDTQRFSSRWALLLSVLGIAVGTGNIWRFPRIAAANGGETGAGAFLIAWLTFLLLWSIPLIIAEYAIGRTGRKGTIGSFVKIAGPKFAWMGGFVGFVSTFIMFYYAVVAGWCVYYFTQMVIAPLPATSVASFAVWEGFQDSLMPAVLLALVFGLGAMACFKGVSSIEKVNKVLVPSLLVIVVLAVVRAVTLPGASEGLKYLFTFEPAQLKDANLWLEALTQNAWDTGAGWGLILTYGAYMKAEQGTVRNAILTGVGNNTVSILAAIMIFGTVFAILPVENLVGGESLSRLQVMQQSGPAATGLTFIWMPQLFAQMPMGNILGILFFLALMFAAFSSLISMIELTTRNLVDLGLHRRKAILITAGAGFLLGLPSALSLDIFVNQDFVWGVALMISGAFVAFAVLRFGVTRFREEHINVAESDWHLGGWWDTLIKFIVPIEAIVLLVWWMYLATTPGFTAAWWDPTELFSLATCLVQWAILLGILLLFNKTMAERNSRSLRGVEFGAPNVD